jgi:glutamyl/glutaminyl-tRNA synthetase
MLTRIAPTPSGYLHLGNCLNFVITKHYAQHHDLEIALRLDVDDQARIRPQYISDVYRILEQLGIDIDVPYSNATDIQSRWSRIWSALLDARQSGLHLYACECSRSAISAGHVCRCHTNIDLHSSANIKLEARKHGLPPHFDGFTLWRKAAIPASVLASLLDDEELHVTHIVRGDDLKSVRNLEQAIAPYFNARHVQDAIPVFHPLLTGLDGKKLSKSAGAQAKPLALQPEQIQWLEEQARMFVRDLQFR